MRDVSHTMIATVRGAIQVWRRREGWSRETVTHEVVKKFNALGGDNLTGIRFDPETTDIVERQKVMADRLFRWLDDESKDANLLPANFLPYLLAALPLDLRIECADSLLCMAGLTVRICPQGIESTVSSALANMAKEVGEGVAAMANLVTDATPALLAEAQKQITEAHAACAAALEVVESVKSGKQP